MKRTKKIISAIILVCFIFNTAVSDFAFAQQTVCTPNTNKLAAASVFSGLKDIETKDIGDIQLWFIACLKYIQHNGLEINNENLRKFADIPGKLPGNTIFKLKDAQFFIGETKELDNGALKIMVRRKDPAHKVRTYFIEYDGKKHDIDVYPEGKTKKRTEQDAKAIKRYIQHEQGIDTILAYAHEHGFAKEPKSRFDYKAEVLYLLKKLHIKVKNPNPKKLIPVEDRKFYLVKLTPEIRSMIRNLPKANVVDAKGNEYEVTYFAHASNNAIHVFVSENTFDIFTDETLSHTMYEAREIAHDEVIVPLNHDIGVMLGLMPEEVRQYGLGDDQRYPINELDKRLTLLSTKPFTKLEELELEIADLDFNLGTRDYAAGKTATKSAVEDSWYFRHHNGTNPQAADGTLSGSLPQNSTNGFAHTYKEGDNVILNHHSIVIDVVKIEKSKKMARILIKAPDSVKVEGGHFRKTNIGFEGICNFDKSLTITNGTYRETVTVKEHDGTRVRFVVSPVTETTQFSASDAAMNRIRELASIALNHKSTETAVKIAVAELLGMASGKSANQGARSVALDKLVEIYEARPEFITQDARSKLPSLFPDAATKQLRHVSNLKPAESKKSVRIGNMQPGPHVKMRGNDGNKPQDYDPSMLADNTQHPVQSQSPQELFALNDETLKLISRNFRADVENRGTKKSSLSNIVTSIGIPTGDEKGEYIFIDLGGTNLRVGLVKFNGGRKFEKKDEIVVPVPSGVQAGGGKELFGLIAKTIKDFAGRNNLSGDIKAGFTFSFAMKKEGLNRGIITPECNVKGYNFDDLAGQDVVTVLHEALSADGLPKFKVVALVNDTEAVRDLGAYLNGTTIAGGVFGTGHNSAVRDSDGRSVNLETAAFDPEGYDLERPETARLDRQIDNLSSNQGAHRFEKMLSGKYIGPLFGLRLEKEISAGRLFAGHKGDLPVIFTDHNYDDEKHKYKGFAGENLSEIENNWLSGGARAVAEYLKTLDIQNPTLEDASKIREIEHDIMLRSAQLGAAEFAGIVMWLEGTEKPTQKHAYAMDGSLLNYPGYIEMMKISLADIFGKKYAARLDIFEARDGSGIGAAITAMIASTQTNTEYAAQEAGMTVKGVGKTPPQKAAETRAKKKVDEFIQRLEQAAELAFRAENVAIRSVDAGIGGTEMSQAYYDACRVLGQKADVLRGEIEATGYSATVRRLPVNETFEELNQWLGNRKAAECYFYSTEIENYIVHVRSLIMAPSVKTVLPQQTQSSQDAADRAKMVKIDNFPPQLPRGFSDKVWEWCNSRYAMWMKEDHNTRATRMANNEWGVTGPRSSEAPRQANVRIWNETTHRLERSQIALWEDIVELFKGESVVSITVTDYAEFCAARGIPKDAESARQELDELVNSGYLDTFSQGGQQRYALTPGKGASEFRFWADRYAAPGEWKEPVRKKIVPDVDLFADAENNDANIANAVRNSKTNDAYVKRLERVEAVSRAREHNEEIAGLNSDSEGTLNSSEDELGLLAMQHTDASRTSKNVTAEVKKSDVKGGTARSSSKIRPDSKRKRAMEQSFGTIGEVPSVPLNPVSNINEGGSNVRGYVHPKDKYPANRDAAMQTTTDDNETGDMAQYNEESNRTELVQSNVVGVEISEEIPAPNIIGNAAVGDILERQGIVEPAEGMKPSSELPEFSLDKVIAEIDRIAANYAENAGAVIPTARDVRYTLLVDDNIGTAEEVEGDRNGFVTPDGRHVGAADRFGIERVNTANIANILAHITDPARTMLQVSRHLTTNELSELRAKAPGLRIIRIDTTGFKYDEGMDADERRLCRFDLYAKLLAARRITKEDILARNSIYRTLSFLIKTHLEEGDDTLADEYIEAIVNDSIESALFIINHNLSYRPVERWRAPNYHLVAITMISA